MKIPGTSDWLIIGSVVLWCMGVVWYVATVYLVLGLLGKSMEKALEMQRQKETMEILEKFISEIPKGRSAAPDMSDALKNVQNVLNMFDPGGSKTPN